MFYFPKRSNSVFSQSNNFYMTILQYPMHQKIIRMWHFSASSRPKDSLLHHMNADICHSTNVTAQLFFVSSGWPARASCLSLWQQVQPCLWNPGSFCASGTVFLNMVSGRSFYSMKTGSRKGRISPVSIETRNCKFSTGYSWPFPWGYSHLPSP